MTPSEAESADTWRQLWGMHITGEIRVGDRVSASGGRGAAGLDDLARMFAGEYRRVGDAVGGEPPRRALLRVEAPLDAHVCEVLPTDTAALDAILDRYGHVLVRTGGPIAESDLIRVLGGHRALIDYNAFGNRTRPNVAGSRALAVTHWPSDFEILPHNELSYHVELPRRLCFISHRPATHGGQTTLFDCRRAYAHLSPAVRRSVTGRHAIFVKRYAARADHPRAACWDRVVKPGTPVGGVVEFFEALGYACAVRREPDGEVVETRIARPIVFDHRGARCLLASIVGTNQAAYRTRAGYRSPTLPEVTWDDGSPFSERVLDEMRDALAQARLNYGPWRAHDVLVLDNLMVAHGRQPYRGRRIVGTMMADPVEFARDGRSWTARSPARPRETS